MLQKSNAVNIKAILLAAGSSTRMGAKNKLLLPYQGQAMVLHILEKLEQLFLQDILVVTGFEEQRITAALAEKKVRFVKNPYYSKGMTSSIQTGILNCTSDTEGFMICLGDMPFLSVEDYQLLLKKFKETASLGARIVVPTVDEKRGNPVIFSAHFRDALLMHPAPNGCKAILKENENGILEVALKNKRAFFDIDTEEEYQGGLSMEN